MARSFVMVAIRLGMASALMGGFLSLRSAEPLNPAVAELIEQNRRLQEQVKAQQGLIEGLHAKLGEVVKASERHERELQGLQDQRAPAPARNSLGGESGPPLRLSAEAGLAFFRTGAGGQYPNAEFRIDEAKIFLEAPVWKNVYFFAGLDLVTREANDEFFHVGELYVDFENVAGLWGRDRLLNLRVGRFHSPFGEEYLTRGVIDNPLISHSLSDIWGIDEGIQLYGAIDRLQYAFAVQNGGHKTLRDFQSDKAFVGKVGFDAASWLRLSASAMRTGKLSAADGMSEAWFGNGFFRALGASSTTQLFWADLVELDGAVRWKTGHLKAAWGRVWFDDDDRAADNARRVRYYHVEGMQRLIDKLHGAVRYSEISAPRGYPLVGWGDFGNYFFRSPLTEELKRLSLGLNYRFGPPLILKLEYAAERGRLTTGASRDQENLLFTEIALRF